MPTLDELTAAPRTLTLAGRQFTVSPLELREWGDLQGWLKDNGQSPLKAVAPGLDALSDGDRKTVLAMAMEKQLRWPPRVATTEWFEAISGSAGGDARFLWAVLRKHQPGLTLEEADRLAQAASVEESQALVLLAIGVDPPPKSPAPSGTATTGRKPRSRSSTTGGRSSTR